MTKNAPIKEERPYVTHTCRNSMLNEQDPNYCYNAFVDIDKTHVKIRPPAWKYCPECVAKGYPNLKSPNLTPKQKERLEKLKANNPSKNKIKNP